MNLNKIIASNLKELRTERNLSIRQLADLCGMSNVMLSQIEKGESNPTINTLLKITTALKVPYTRLIDEVRRDATIVRKSDRIPLMGESPAYQIFNYFPFSPQRNFEFFQVELEPHSKSQSSGHSKMAQEYIFVIHGTLNLLLNDKELVLNAQDAAYFESSVHHIYENKTGDPLQFISINYYP